MRIIAGRLRGRALLGPSGPGTRPTADRVRGAIFNILAHSIDGFVFDGVRVLDLFAGTGALGLEALSRGAGYCLFVERSAKARSLVRANIDALGLETMARISSLDALRLGPLDAGEAFALAFLDPPYGEQLADQALAAACRNGWLADGAVVVVEERAGVALRWPVGFTLLDERGWGETQAVFARYRASR